MTEVEVRWFDVTDAAELWEGDLVDFDVEGEQVMLAHLIGGEIKAFQAMCPHQEIPLAHGEFDVDTCELTCTGHSWKFDLRTGQGTNPVGCELYSFPVRVEGEKIQVGVAQDGKRHYCRFSGVSEVV
jgi:toluene monooxygenase system ferredoxin subunit